MAGPWLRRLRRSWPIVVGGLIVVALVVQVVRPEAHDVETGVVARGPMRVTLDEDGQTRWRETFMVTAPVGGTLSRVQVEPGDTVARGALLATLQPGAPPLLDARTRAGLQAQVEAAQAAVGRAEAEADAVAAVARQAEVDLARTRPLVKVGAVSQAGLDAMDVAFQTARQQQAAARFAVGVARHQLDAARASLRAGAQAAGGGAATAVRIEAPVDGIVLRRPRVSAGVVQPGEPLVEIGDPTTLEVVADYLSTEAVRLAPGTRIVVDGWDDTGRVLTGRVRRVEPGGFTKISALGVEEQRVNVVVAAADTADAWASLGDGYRVRTRAVVWEGDAVLTVPLGSLFRRGDGWAVFVVEAGRAVERPVEIGHQSETAVEILRGVEEGESIVLHPGDRIADGVRVRP